MSWFLFFFFKQKPAYEMRISDWSSDVCSSDLQLDALRLQLVTDAVGLGEVPSLTRLIAGVDFLGNQQAKNRIQRFLIFFGFVPAKEIGQASCRARVCQ